MGKIIDFLKGKKVYLLGLGVIGYGLYNHFFNGHVSWEETITTIFDGSLIMAVRAALAKVGITVSK